MMDEMQVQKKIFWREANVEVKMMLRWKLSQEDLEKETTVGSEQRMLYKDSILGYKGKTRSAKSDSFEEGEVSDDDHNEESADETLFGMEMSREEEIEAGRPCKTV